MFFSAHVMAPLRLLLDHMPRADSIWGRSSQAFTDERRWGETVLDLLSFIMICLIQRSLKVVLHLPQLRNDSHRVGLSRSLLDLRVLSNDKVSCNLPSWPFAVKECNSHEAS